MPLMLWLALSARWSGAQTNTMRSPPRDCLGSGSTITIRPGRVGNLSLHLSLKEILQRCKTIHWSTINGDEMLDTAIVLDHGQLHVIGAVATLGDESGWHRPLHIDTQRPVKWWQVSGVSGMLPNGVQTTATWSTVRQVYGPLRGSALNGTVYVAICRKPGLTLLMDLPSADAPINGAPAEVVDSVMAKTRIRAVLVASATTNPMPDC